MANNNKLIDQIHETIMEEYKEELQRCKESELKFFVRKGDLQKAYPSEELVFLNNQVDLVKSKSGLTEENIEDLCLLIENGLLKSKPFEHGHIFVNYSLNSDGTEFDDFRMRVEREVHYKKEQPQEQEEAQEG